MKKKNHYKGAKLVYGFRTDVSKEQIRKSIEDGSIEKYLQYVPVHRGDVFFIKAGTVHAIGAGILLAEIQESSNLTYRRKIENHYNPPSK